MAILRELPIEAQVACAARRSPASRPSPTRPPSDVLWLGPDEWLVLGGREADFADAAAAVDVSANRVALELAGPDAARPRPGCALDLHPSSSARPLRPDAARPGAGDPRPRRRATRSASSSGPRSPATSAHGCRTRSSALAFATAAAWEAWLEEHHADATELWLKIARKASRHATVTLCRGARRRALLRLDRRRSGTGSTTTTSLQRFTPRRARAAAGRRSTAQGAALIEAGRMRPAGLREVERAKADGRWDAAYDGSATATCPTTCRRELDARPAAAAFFAASTAATATRSSTASRTRSARRRGRAGSRSSSRCSRRGRRCTRGPAADAGLRPSRDARRRRLR